MKGMIQQLYDKRCEKQRELEKKASSGYDVLEKMAGAVATLEKCAKTDWGDVTARIVGTAAPAAIGALGGAAIGGIADAIRPKAKDERDRKKRLVKSLLTGAAFGGLAGAGFSAYNYQAGGPAKGSPLGFFDVTWPDAAGYTLAGAGAYNSGLFHRKFNRPGPMRISVSGEGRASMDDIIRSFENGALSESDFLKKVFGHKDVMGIHGGSNAVPPEAVGKANEILRRAKYAVKYPKGGAFWKGGWRGGPKKIGAITALIAGLGLIGNKYTELFGDRD